MTGSAPWEFTASANTVGGNLGYGQLFDYVDRADWFITGSDPLLAIATGNTEGLLSLFDRTAELNTEHDSCPTLYIGIVATSIRLLF